MTPKKYEATRYKPHWKHERINPAYCRAAVFGPRVSVSQCSKKVKPGIEWCGTHSPEAIRRREEKREQRDREWREGWKRREAQDRRERRLIEGAEKMLRPETWDAFGEEIRECFAGMVVNDLVSDSGDDTLAHLAAKHVRKILGEEE